MTFAFHPEALAEYEEAARYYARCRPQLDWRFVTAIEATIDRMLNAPERWPLLEDDVRACKAEVFPYAVLFTIEKDFILIIAVMHCHREPGYWRARR